MDYFNLCLSLSNEFEFEFEFQFAHNDLRFPLDVKYLGVALCFLVLDNEAAEELSANWSIIDQIWKVKKSGWKWLEISIVLR